MLVPLYVIGIHYGCISISFNPLGGLINEEDCLEI